jgi:SAM-dependent methyltransferase
MENDLKLYARSQDFLWTDAHIAANMLAAHLDPEHDAASRNPRSIRKTVEWIARETKGGRRLLDLGCGPGLYAESLDARGYSVTGIDINPLSIEHARRSARQHNRAIEYINMDYLRGQVPGNQDVAICIYCDFGALIPTEQVQFLQNVHGALSDDGILIFDVFGNTFSNTCRESRVWSYIDGPSFWSPTPHYLLEESVHFKAAKVWGRRSIVLGDGQEAKEFITWDHYFGRDEIQALLARNGFEVEKVRTGLVEKNAFTSNNVNFVKARKSRA